jgi:hypothetical protein
VSILGIIASSKLGVPATSYESIATATSGSDTITFSSIPQTYKHLQIRFSLFSGASYSPSLRINGATSGYAYHNVKGVYDGSTNTVSAEGYGTPNSSIQFANSIGLSSTYPTVGIIDINDYTSASKNPVIRTLAGQDTNSTGYNWIQLSSGLYTTSGAVTSLTLFIGGNTFTGESVVSLYGIKGE